MLVLSRRKYEEIFIGDDIIVSVVEILDGKVRIGVHAPRDMPIHRREIYMKIKKKKAEKLELEQGQEKESATT